jgi:hypothetical protein
VASIQMQAWPMATAISIDGVMMVCYGFVHHCCRWYGLHCRQEVVSVVWVSKVAQFYTRAQHW